MALKVLYEKVSSSPADTVPRGLNLTIGNYNNLKNYQVV